MMLYLNWTSNAEHDGSKFRLIAQPPHIIAVASSCIYLPHHFQPPKKPWKSTPAHDEVAAALSHKHHPLIHVELGADPIQLVYGSPL